MIMLPNQAARSATGPVLTVERLSVLLSRNGRPFRVLDDVSLQAFAGEIIALVGESGSGKSSLGLALQGLLPQPYLSGSIRLGEIELVGAEERVLRSARRHLVRAIPQDPMGSLNPTMTIRCQMRESSGAGEESILAWLRRTGISDPERIADAFPHRLSGGQRQRVLIAMAMIAEPKLLVADEPTTALDVTVQAQILDLLRDLARERQTAILFITHDLGVAASLADRALVLYAGRIVETGSIESVIHKPAHPYSAGLLAARFDLETDRSRPLPTLPAERKPASTGSACAYASRCPLVEADCIVTKPSLRPVSRLSEAACLHVEHTPLLTERNAVAKPWPAETIRESVVALELSNVGKSYPIGARSLWAGRRPRSVLGSVNLVVRLGECVALVGESGSGKSTILRIAAGLLPADNGKVVRAEEAQPQMVFQDPVSALTPWLTIGEQIGERLRNLRRDVRNRRRQVGEVLQLVGLDTALMDALPAELSVGQCQRAVVARAVVVPPKLLLCDEPISAMDVSLAATTLNLLQDLRRRLGMAMLFVTHDLAAARIVADRVVVLHDGSLTELANLDAPSTVAQAAYTRTLIASIPRLQTGRTQ